ncbi:polysaccharide biosynthesis protein [Orrella daihaiensis]|uniref:Polysaccharide biosynthesis protein n=1 Tax=Orrella daihaiensis TaxID=2782176 RepID=A0ABY4AM48_9BURK|nr:nucleoside-diphosphate sugar epimerase/dehydratase [Orrella daihaiensis]UOD51391.1 polysaccharide biosynthesis protein [Orrella daihaiensis]
MSADKRTIRLDLTDPLLDLPRPVKRAIVLLLDTLLCVVCVWLAFYLRLDEWIRLYNDPYWHGDWASAISVAIAIPLFVTHGFYRVIFRHANLVAIGMVARAFALYGAIYATIITVIGLPGIPRSVGIIQPLLLLVGVGASRAIAHYWLGGAYHRILKRASLPKALIYGAGVAGRQLAVAMAGSQEMRVVGFLDDDKRLHRQMLHNLKIYDPTDLQSIVSDNGVTTILLALPSINRHRRNEILAMLKAAKVAVRTLPSVTDLAQGKVTVSDLRELEIEDLLGRDPVPPDHALLSKNIQDKVVLVTGAGGSIGSELCRQIVDISPKKLVLLEQSEFALYQIHAELDRRVRNLASDSNKQSAELVALLGSVQDEQQMTDIMHELRPDTVYHAAAYKHVPLVEANPTQGIKNNVFGTLVTAKAALDAGVSDFVLISTDKAVRPTNVMGASKRLAEMVLQAMAAESASDSKTTRFSMVRFGNVLGSSGSVVPKFRQQIRDGGPVTVTDAEVTRYFMTIPEAAQLVIQAGAMAKGGDVYVLEMGESVKIMDLAKRMIELSGLTLKTPSHPDGDIAIEITGLRPGEKLYEELLIGNNPQATSHPRIMRANEEYLSWPELTTRLETLAELIRHDDHGSIGMLLRQLVSGYEPSKGRGQKI